MTPYQFLAKYGTKFVGRHRLMKYGFNWMPMYRRSTARLIEVSEDLTRIRIKLAISYKNKNYVGSIFGGSMFSAVDPIPMVQLINLLESQYVVWDKTAEIRFKAPAREDLYADFTFSPEELASIKDKVNRDGEMELEKLNQLTNRDGSKVYCEVSKTIYVATKAHYKTKRARRPDRTVQAA